MGRRESHSVGSGLGLPTANSLGSRLRLGISHRATVLLVAGMVLYTLFHWLVLPFPVGARGLTDTGWVSWFTMAAQGAVLILIVSSLRAAPTARSRLGVLVLSYVALVYLLREADFHRLFTVDHVTRLDFYFDAEAPVSQRLIAGLVMSLFFGCLIALVTCHGARTLRALRSGRPWAVSLFLAGFLLVLSQVVDQTMRNLYVGTVIEEVLEASAACLVLLTVLHYRNQRHDE